MVPDRWTEVWDFLDFWGHVSLLALIVAAVGQTLFVVVYSRRPWWMYRVGRALMGKSFSLSVVLILTVIGWFYHLPEWISAIAVCAIACFIWYQTYVLITSPRHLDPEQETAHAPAAQ